MKIFWPSTSAPEISVFSTDSLSYAKIRCIKCLGSRNLTDRSILSLTTAILAFLTTFGFVHVSLCVLSVSDPQTCCGMPQSFWVFDNFWVCACTCPSLCVCVCYLYLMHRLAVDCPWDSEGSLSRPLWYSAWRCVQFCHRSAGSVDARASILHVGAICWRYSIVCVCGLKME